MNQRLCERDILLTTIKDEILVTSVDSCGAIGMKPHDKVIVTPETTGMLTARVALMEVLCAGAAPIYAALNSCNDPATSELVLSGVKSVLGYQVPIIISTEKNMDTCMTAIGVCITGRVSSHGSGLRIGCAQPGDALYCAGRPMVGSEVMLNWDDMVTIEHLNSLLDNKTVHTIIPVGSKGIASEAVLLAGESDLTINWDNNTDIDLFKSGGPSTCVLFTATEEEAIAFNMSIPVKRLGVLR